MSNAFFAHFLTVSYAALKKQQSFPAVSLSGVWQITASGCEDQPVKRNGQREQRFFCSFLNGFLCRFQETAIFSGCFLEWRLADNGQWL